ncbi:MAG: hydroxylamine reductase [Anaerolineales bacterium]
MFCYQCQETARNQGCTVRGVCGKPSRVATLQDLLIWLIKGISFWGTNARRNLGVVHPQTDLFVAQALFSTITNANFDEERFVALIGEALERREALRSAAQAACQAKHGKPCFHALPEAATWAPESLAVDALLAKGATVGILADPSLNEDVRSLRSLILFGIKGLSAYTDHAYVLEHHNEDVMAFIQEALAATLDDSLSVDDLVALTLKTGQMGLEAMRLLDEANTATFGHPEPTQVQLGVREGPAILVSGHDLRDLDELLQQTADLGINVYTHGEMLPANAYPGLKKYPHLAGNYGGSWWHQNEEFKAFGGPIVLTTNCLIPPDESYIDRLFTTGMVGWPGCTHIADRRPGEQKDWSPVIAAAQVLPGPRALESGTIPIGYARNTLMSVADQVIAAIQSGAITRLVVMGGCDGRMRSRAYYTEVAQNLPPTHVILTAGCAKYRYNKLGLGEIGGIPRVLDAGQCNDSYSLIYVAQQLAQVLNVSDVNELPISFDIAWYEQKAVIVLLALLAVGVKHIRLGPTLPAFLSPNVTKVLVEHFDLKPISTVEADVAAIVAGQ